jgi:hypothetical protein
MLNEELSWIHLIIVIRSKIKAVLLPLILFRIFRNGIMRIIKYYKTHKIKINFKFSIILVKRKYIIA